jgi:hypothetical protein
MQDTAVNCKKETAPIVLSAVMACTEGAEQFCSALYLCTDSLFIWRSSPDLRKAIISLVMSVFLPARLSFLSVCPHGTTTRFPPDGFS